MSQGSVIQGTFPQGIAHLTRAQHAPAQPLAAPPAFARPAWVQQRIGNGAVTQPKAPAPSPPPSPARVHATANGSAVSLPAPLSAFANHGGSPLPPAVRQKMEAVFGTGFHDVRVHVGPHVSAIGALAFTQGTHIHFAPGQYDPNSARGQQILGHELAHVVQQRAGRVRNPFSAGVTVVHDQALEAEAHRMGLRAATPSPPPRTLQRARATAYPRYDQIIFPGDVMEYVNALVDSPAYQDRFGDAGDSNDGEVEEKPLPAAAATADAKRPAVTLPAFTAGGNIAGSKHDRLREYKRLFGLAEHVLRGHFLEEKALKGLAGSNKPNFCWSCDRALISAVLAAGNRTSRVDIPDGAGFGIIKVADKYYVVRPKKAQIVFKKLGDLKTAFGITEVQAISGAAATAAYYGCKEME